MKLHSKARQKVLPAGGWLIYVIGIMCPLWLFAADTFYRSTFHARLLSDSSAYILFSAGAVLAITVACRARTTLGGRVALSVAELFAEGFCFLLMVFISLAKLGPINPG